MKCTSPNCHCGPAGCPWKNGAAITPAPTAADVLFPGLSEPSRPIRSGDRITLDGCEIIAKVTTAPIRSGDRIATGTGPARRRLTQAEAEAGGLPEPFTRDEWRAMAQASRCRWR